jgi:hypothetical protein
MFARVRFDGNGNLIADTAASGSPLASFQYAGAYTVNLDCSGTITFTTGSGTTATSIAGSFVLTPPPAYLNPSVTNLSGYSERPGILYTLTNATETISGYGRAQ